MAPISAEIEWRIDHGEGGMQMLEREITTRSMVLGEHETTGLLPVGFEFEWHGSRYDRFGLSTDGFLVFGRGERAVGARARVPLPEQSGGRLRGGRVSYEVQGIAPRRRFAVSLDEAGSLTGTLEIAIHERTGIVEVWRTGQSFGDPTIRQLDMVQSSPSRENSARKMG
jgi:hypothetical protein